MDTSAVSTNYVTGTTKPTSRGFNDMNGQDFMSLMIEELKSQDPMNPTSNKELVAQMASIRQMEQSNNLNSTLGSLAAEQRFGATSGLIGHYVAGTVTDSGGNDTVIQGVVTGVRFQSDGSAILDLHNGHSLPANKVEQITLVENLPPDLQQQLQQEMNAQANGTDNGNNTAAARAIGADAPTKAGVAARHFGRQVNQTASLLDSLFAKAPAV